MERRIGEQFDYNGVTLEVAKSPKGHPCCDCYFLLKDCYAALDKTGNCSDTFRNDKRNVYFKEVKK